MNLVSYYAAAIALVSLSRVRNFFFQEGVYLQDNHSPMYAQSPPSVSIPASTPTLTVNPLQTTEAIPNRGIYTWAMLIKLVDQPYLISAVPYISLQVNLLDKPSGPS
jgi:hypothetical protein